MDQRPELKSLNPLDDLGEVFMTLHRNHFLDMTQKHRQQKKNR